MEMEKRLYTIMSQIFDIPLSAISMDSTAETMPEWDSMNHINLVLALEGEFGIQFTPEQIAEIISVQSILKVFAELGHS